MNAFFLRILMATTLSCVSLWVLYELAWIPWQYDRESEALEAELDLRAEALREQFDTLDPADWDATVAQYNRSTDEYHTLIRQTDADWPDLIARIRSDGNEGVLTDGYDSIAAVLLPDDKTILHMEVFYIETDETFDAPFWGFISAAIALSALLLHWVLTSQNRRYQSITQAIDQFREDHRRIRVPVRGEDLLGEVEGRINALIGHLDEAIGDLHESIGTQRDLMHAVAHEFRGPIARLRFASDLAGEAESDEERAELLGKIDQAIQELDDLVKEVLGYSRIRHGGYRLELEALDLQAAVQAVITKVRAEFPAVEFEVEPGESVDVEADARMLERAVINVARNAGRFAQQKVRVSIRTAPDAFEVRIADDGPGIAPGKRERIFEPFTRLDASRSRGSGGSGLGLAIVMAISQQHDGTVACGDSELGGAEFIIRWPVSHDPHEALTDA